MQGVLRLISLIVALVSWAPSVVALEFTYTPFTVPSVQATGLSGINDSGKVVGHSQLPNQAFVASGSIITPISFSNDVSTTVFDINNHGHAVGSYFDGINPAQGFRFDGTTYTPINSSDGQFLAVGGISDTGHIVGTFETTVGTVQTQQGFLLHPDGTFTILSAPGSTLLDARGINNMGQIVGRFRNDIGAEQGFLYSNGVYTPIIVPGAIWTNATDINNSGAIVGNFHDGTTEHGFHYLNNVFFHS